MEILLPQPPEYEIISVYYHIWLWPYSACSICVQGHSKGLLWPAVAQTIQTLGLHSCLRSCAPPLSLMIRQPA